EEREEPLADPPHGDACDILLSRGGLRAFRHVDRGARRQCAHFKDSSPQIEQEWPVRPGRTTVPAYATTRSRCWAAASSLRTAALPSSAARAGCRNPRAVRARGPAPSSSGEGCGDSLATKPQSRPGGQLARLAREDLPPGRRATAPSPCRCWRHIVEAPLPR